MTFPLALAIMLTATQALCASETFSWRSIKTNDDFQPIRAHLQHLVDSNGNVRTNRLCVIGQNSSDNYENAYVYWPTMNKLILWEPNRDTLDDIALSRRYLDLTTDVVKGDDVRGSSYQVTRSWADAVIHACKQHGQTMIIVKGATRG